VCAPIGFDILRDVRLALIALLCSTSIACGQAGGFRYFDDGGSMDAVPSDTVAEDAGVPADADLPIDTGINPDAGPEFVLTSTTIQANAPFPVDATCFGIDTQPDLEWSGVPPGTRSFVVVLIGTTMDYVHWVAFDLPATITGLPAGASNHRRMPPGTMEAHAYCDFYCGPCPPVSLGVQTYELRVYALDVPTIAFTSVNPIGNEQLRNAFSQNTLGIARLQATSMHP
jgi:Raf kinase inhibitor-like YbhB/YbcL family protein